MDMQLVGTREKGNLHNKRQPSPESGANVDYDPELPGVPAPEIFWLTQLANAPSPLDLPTDYARLLPNSYRRERNLTLLDPELTAALGSAAVTLDCPVYVILVAVFATLTHRLSGREDLVLAASFSGIIEGADEKSLGASPSKTLPLRSRAEFGMQFSDYLERIKRLVEVEVAYQEAFSERILEGLNSPNGPFQFPAVHFEYLGNGKNAVGLEREYFESDAPSGGWEAEPELTLKVSDSGESMELVCEYSSALYRPETIQRWVGHFKTLLKSVLHDPESELWELPILTEFERNTMISDWNKTDADFPDDTGMAELFEIVAARTPDAIAIEHQDVRWTYKELNERANRLAHVLQEAGGGLESLIGICLERSPEMIAGMLAILKVGGAYVPIDPDYPDDRCARMLDHSSLLITSKGFAVKFRESKVRIIESDVLMSAGGETSNLLSGVRGDNLAYVIYTSGSTGQPKGVAATHRGVARLLFNSRFINFRSSDGVAQILNLSFDASVQEVWGALLHGARLVIIDKDVILAPTRFAQELEMRGVTILNPPAALFNVIANELPHAFANLRYVVFGGEAADARSVAAVLKHGPPENLINAYGPAEATVAAACLRIEEIAENAASVPIGKPICNTSIYLLDRSGNPVPIGVVGEIFIGGPGVARGYIGAPELTNERFLADPFSKEAGARFYKTGDQAKWLADGSLEFIGRTDFQVKIRGFRIEPGEIVAVLKQYPTIRDAVVEVLEKEGLGKQLVAYVTGDPAELGESGVRDFLKARLPHYMVPSVITVLRDFPLTSNGKVDRRALQQAVATRGETEFLGPRDSVEEQLALIWGKALNVSSVGLNDDFFELGGHSLTAVRIFSEIEKSHGISLSLATLSEASTIEKLAEFLRVNKPEAGDLPNAHRIVPLARAPITAPAMGSLDSDIPRVASFAQRRLWFIDQLRPGSCEYNLPFAIRIRGDLNVSALAHSLTKLVARHEVLRTTFRAVEGEPIQFVALPQEVTLPVTDLRGLSELDLASRERELVESAAWTPFELAKGPLIRTSLLRTRDDEHVLVINLHHIIFDHWSDKILMGELTEGYKAFTEGRNPVLPDLPIQYADYAHWQRDFHRRKEFEEQFAYWCKQLEDLPRLQLPTDRANTGLQPSKGANASIDISSELTDALKTLARAEKATFFMTVLAAFKVLLARYTGQEDIVVGSPIADRNRSDVAPLIGLFLNTLVFRTNLDGNPTFREVLGRVRRMALEAYKNQDLPFDSLVEALAPERDLTQNPLFQVAFVLVDGQPGTYSIGDLTCDRIEVEDRTAKFDLTVMFLEDQNGVHGNLNYNANLFEAETMRRMAGHLAKMLKGIAANPDTRIWDLPMLTEPEKEQILVDWNRTDAVYPDQASVTQIFEKRAAETPEAVAIVHEGEALTYRELNGRANQVSRLLREAGSGPGSLVGVCLDRSIELIVGVLAILKTGATYVPINPNYPEERKALMLEGASLIVTTKEVYPQYASTNLNMVDVASLDLTGVDAGNLPNELNGESTLAILYTSGSTGNPKGVKILHRAVLALVLNTNYIKIEEVDSVAFRANIGFDVALFEIWGPLLNGARLVVIDHEVQLSPARFVSEMRRHQVSILWITTSLFHLLASEMPVAFAGLRHVLVGGEILDPESVRTVMEHGAPLRLSNAYGPTETTAFSSTYDVWSVSENARTVPIGKPIANTRIYLLDRSAGLVPIGVLGEIYIGGAGVAAGYLNAPELTEKRFLPDLFSNDPRARLYRTGDLARWLPDGSVDFVGRADNQVKIRGFRIELAEIEMVLKQHLSVRDAVVIVQEREKGDKRLIAYVAGDPAELSESEIHDFLKVKLPDYALPSAIVVMKEFPFNNNGKVDRRSLPEPVINSELKEVVLPRDAVETQLRAIWEKVLKVEPISVTDDFFKLGGHSLLAVRIFLEIEKAFGKSFPLATLFSAPTIQRLAEKVREEALGTEWAPVVAVQLQGSQVPFFAIHGRDGNVLFYRNLSEQLGIKRPFYALQSQGLDGKPITRTTVEEMAEYYVEEIQKIRPKGPYLLGGYSFGGAVAYEIARRLELAGEEVALVALFDTFNPANPPRLRSVGARLKQRISDPSTITFNRLFQFLARRTGGKTGATILKWNEVFHKLVLGWKAKQESQVSAELLGLHVRMVHESAFQAYKPLEYAGKITLFRPLVHPPGYEFDADLGWINLALGGVEIHIVSGDHDTIFSDENVPSLAQKLEECIQAAVLKHPELT